MLNPAGLRVDLLVFPLCVRNDAAAFVEYDEAGAGRALIDCANELRHSGDGLAVVRDSLKNRTKERRNPHLSVGFKLLKLARVENVLEITSDQLLLLC